MASTTDLPLFEAAGLNVDRTGKTRAVRKRAHPAAKPKPCPKTVREAKTSTEERWARVIANARQTNGACQMIPFPMHRDRKLIERFVRRVLHVANNVGRLEARHYFHQHQVTEMHIRLKAFGLSQDDIEDAVGLVMLEMNRRAMEIDDVARQRMSFA